MKAAILGTNDYHATMQQIAKNALQRQAGYIAPVARGAINLNLQSVHECFAVHADTIVRTLLEDGSLFNCNARSPYLFLAWILGGLDSPYRLRQALKDDKHSYHRIISRAYIHIALGQTPRILMSQRFYQFLNHCEADQSIVEDVVGIAVSAALARNTRSAFRLQIETSEIWDGLITRLTSHIEENPKIYPQEFSNSALEYDKLKQLASNYLTCNLREWMYLTDAELLPIIRQLTLDVLEVKA